MTNCTTTRGGGENTIVKIILKKCQLTTLKRSQAKQSKGSQKNNYTFRFKIEGMRVYQ
jgi:hypothetical protein